MELWVEYLIRRKLERFIVPERLDIPTTPQISVRRSYLTEIQMWMYFLTTYKPIIRVCSPNVSELCGGWTREFIRGGNKMIPISEQKRIVFCTMPHLEEVWAKWTAHMLRSSVSMPEITI
jgi:hypothetical protein